jgi:hypothetical protein
MEDEAADPGTVAYGDCKGSQMRRVGCRREEVDQTARGVSGAQGRDRGRDDRRVRVSRAFEPRGAAGEYSLTARPES